MAKRKTTTTRRRRTTRKKVIEETPYMTRTRIVDTTPSEYREIQYKKDYPHYGAVSVVFGILGILFPMLIFPQVLALVFGYKQKHIRSTTSSTIGLILGWISTILVLLVLFFSLWVIMTGGSLVGLLSNWFPVR